MEEKSHTKSLVIISATVLVVLSLVIGLKFFNKYEKNKLESQTTISVKSESTYSASTTCKTLQTVTKKVRTEIPTNTGVSVSSIESSTSAKTKERSNTTNKTQSNDSNGKVLSSIKIISTPSKTNYYTGDKLSLDGIVVKAYYNDGSSKDVTSQIKNDSIDTYKNGNKSIKIKYSEKGVTKTTSFSVTYKKPSISITSIEVDVNIGKTVQLSTTVKPSGCKVIWKSASNSIASVNEKGVVKGISSGKTTILASIVYNGSTYYSEGCVIVVSPEASTLKIQDFDWNAFIENDKSICVETVYGSISSNYSLTCIQVGLIGPAYVNGEYTKDYNQYYEITEENIHGKSFNLSDFVSLDFDTVLDNEYVFYVYAEDSKGGTAFDYFCVNVSYNY